MRLPILVLMLLICLPAMAQADPIRQRILQRLSESDQFFKQGNYDMGANRLDEAASMVQSRRSAYPESSPIDIAAKGVEYLTQESAAARKHNDDNAANRALLAQHSLLRSLCTWDSQNPKWLFTRGLMYTKLSNGTDPSQLRLAIRDFDAASTCPGSAAYKEPCSQMRAKCEQQLGGSASGGATNLGSVPITGGGRGTNIGSMPIPGGGRMSPNGIYHPSTVRVNMAPDKLHTGPWGPGLGRARVDWSKLPIPRAGSGNSSQDHYCPNCHAWNPAGASQCGSCDFRFSY